MKEMVRLRLIEELSLYRSHQNAIFLGVEQERRETQQKRICDLSNQAQRSIEREIQMWLHQLE
jgi:hypothetical protein